MKDPGMPFIFFFLPLGYSLSVFTSSVPHIGARAGWWAESGPVITHFVRSLSEPVRLSPQVMRQAIRATMEAHLPPLYLRLLLSAWGDKTSLRGARFPSDFKEDHEGAMASGEFLFPLKQ